MARKFCQTQPDKPVWKQTSGWSPTVSAGGTWELCLLSPSSADKEREAHSWLRPVSCLQSGLFPLLPPLNLTLWNQRFLAWAFWLCHGAFIRFQKTKVLATSSSNFDPYSPKIHEAGGEQIKPAATVLMHMIQLRPLVPYGSKLSAAYTGFQWGSRRARAVWWRSLSEQMSQ